MDVEMEDSPLATAPSHPALADHDLMDIDEPATNGSSAEIIVTPADEDDSANADDTDKEDDDGTKKWIVNPAPKPRKISERKRADNAAFDTWIEENQQNLSKGLDKFVVNADKSFQSLIMGFENKRIITSPRDYQLELFELAKVQNTIAVLDTGSGKTLIAALLLRWTIQNELEDRSKGQPKRIAFFLVDKVALVFQQHAVLTCNLDYPVDKFCGDMVEHVGKEFWEKALADNMAIVCTADILNQCLHHSFVRMEQINLLVFDEAHHTKKNHPYARIIKDFYATVEDEKMRPRILGMTASPVDAQIDPKIAAAELEGLLHSQIATISDPAALQHSATKLKKEILVEYDRRRQDWETELNQALRELVGGHTVFRKPFAFTATAAAELGPWCADRYWQLFFRGEEMAKLESRTERELLRKSAYSQGMDLHINKVREAHRLVKEHTFARPSADSTNLLSPKVILLYRILRDQFSGVDHNRRCIVFVRQRNIASLLADLLQQPEMRIPGLKPGALVGGGAPEASWDNSKVTYREQVLTIIKFKKGELNCIFATSVAEEGLDIPDCNVIIRYDLNNTLIQYIQSRGRARQEDSVFIHMAERGNPDHVRKLMQTKHSEDALRKFCEAMPDDRKLTGNNFDMDYFLRKEKGQRQYTIPETGAKLNYKQSLLCVAAFVASLPHPPEVNLTANYVVLHVPEGFQCEVMLPDTSPIKSATGRIHASKALAKASAAYELCLQLIKDKYLDQHLRPTFTKQLPAMRNARLAVSSKKKEQYNMRIKPEIWSTLGEPAELYVMALTLANPAALGRPSSPLLLLTRQPIQDIASFPLYYGKNLSSTVHCGPASGRVKLDDSRTQGLVAFTLTVFKDVFSKHYEATAAQLPYFLAPTQMEHGSDFASVSDPCSIIDWTAVMFVKENERIVYRFNDEPDDFFTDKYVADPFDGSRKFFLRGRRHDMKPRDSVPEGIVAPGHRAWRISCEDRDVLNYSLSAWSKSRASMILREDQPVVEAELLPIRRNLLDDNIGDDDLESKPCFLILEPLRISPLPVNVVAMLYNFPAIMHRIDSNLVALEACRMLGLNIRPDLALEAFTKDSDNSDEHDAEQVNFQSGMGNNYERLEFLGDCFLKMATTISIFTLIPDKAEFEYHVERMLLICNRNLFNNALEHKLEEYIRSMAFDRRSWYPEGLTLKRGKYKDISRQHVLADKTIADVCEALIGAAYLTAQSQTPPNFDLAIRAVTTMVKSPNHAMAHYPDYYAAYVPPPWQTAPSNSTQTDMASRFAARMGYAFTHPRLLRSAFQHPTYPSVYEKLPSYQRLEFLGDALLDMASVEFLFHRFPGADPQWLTEHKMAMVSNQFLGCLAVVMGFHTSVMQCSAAVQREVGGYVAEIEEALAAAKEEAVRLGRGEGEYRKDFWVQLGRPPKCLPDVVEAYVGAVFVDSRYDFGEVRRFFEGWVRPFFEDMRLYDTFANKHPVTFLAGVMQGRMRCGEWRLLVKELPPVGVDGGGGGGGGDGEDANGGAASVPAGLMMGTPQVVCAVRVHGLTLAHAVGQSSRYGKIAAAKKALKVLEGMEVDEFRKAYGCACVVRDGEGEAQDGDHGSAI